MLGPGCAYRAAGAGARGVGVCMGGRRGARGWGVHGRARGAEADNLGRHSDREGLALATPQQGRCPRQ
eukprot:6417221-Prymnesium_polylepis.2